VSALVATGEYGVVSAVPPVVVKNQPTKVEPPRVGAAGRVRDPPVWKDEAETVLPPKVSKVTTFVFAVHCAYIEKSEVFVGVMTTLALPSLLPPTAESNHPLNE